MSRPQVTITLGRSGQVVKRSGATSDDVHLDYSTFSRGKRSIRERLGSTVDNPKFYGRQPNTKRCRQDYVVDGGWQYISNARVGREDLRLKLMDKNTSKRTLSDSDEHDLRERLSRTVRYPARIVARPHMPEPRVTGFMRRIPPTRSADDLLHTGSLRKPYPVWTLDDLRRISPGVEKNLDFSRVIRSQRSIDASWKIPLPDEPTVTSLLHLLGLGKYSILFQAEEVDMIALKQMKDNDLKELGIPMGPRKKILRALPRARPRRSRKMEF